MAHIPCDTRTCRWNGGSFRPTGRLLTFGTASENPAKLQPKRALWSARLFVGFNVGGQPRWDIDDLARVVFAERKRQGKSPDASLLMQKGIYQSIVTGRPETEDGAQVIVLNLDGTPVAQFRRDMLRLAEVIAKKMKQELVIVEVQKDGVSQQIWEVTP